MIGSNRAGETSLSERSPQSAKSTSKQNQVSDESPFTVPDDPILNVDELTNSNYDSVEVPDSYINLECCESSFSNSSSDDDSLRNGHRKHKRKRIKTSHAELDERSIFDDEGDAIKENQSLGSSFRNDTLLFGSLGENSNDVGGTRLAGDEASNTGPDFLSQSSDMESMTLEVFIAAAGQTNEEADLTSATSVTPPCRCDVSDANANTSCSFNLSPNADTSCSFNLPADADLDSQYVPEWSPLYAEGEESAVLDDDSILSHIFYGDGCAAGNDESAVLELSNTEHSQGGNKEPVAVDDVVDLLDMENNERLLLNSLDGHLGEPPATTHHSSHMQWFGESHKLMTIKEFQLSPNKYRKRYCAGHEELEISLTCLKCQLLACFHCDLIEDCTKKGKHDLMAVDKLEKDMSANYEDLVKSLSTLLTRITDAQNSTFADLESLVCRSKQMVAEVDRSSKEQIEEIQLKTVKVKKTITEYVSERTKQVEEFAAHLHVKREQAENLIEELRKFTSETHIVDKIQNYSQQKQMVSDMMAMELGECILVEKFIQLKAQSRDVEVSIGVVPVGLELNAQYRSTALSGDCEAVAFLGKDKFVAGYESGLEVIAKSSEGGLLNRFTANCKGDIEAVARHPDAMIIALCAEEETMTIKYFSYPSLSFVKDLCSYWRNGNSFSHLAVTKAREIIVTDESNNQLRVYSLEGKELYVIPVPAISAYSSVYCQPNNTILVSQCSENGSLLKYKLNDAAATLVWKCSKLQNPTGICANESGLILVGSETRKAVFMISPSGCLLGELFLMDLPTPGVWDLSLYKSQLLVAVSEGVRIYTICYGEENKGD